MEAFMETGDALKYALVGVAILLYMAVVVLLEIWRKSALKKDMQKACPYCHGKKILYIKGGKGPLKMAYLPKEGVWKVTCGPRPRETTATVRLGFCPDCGRDMSRRG